MCEEPELGVGWGDGWDYKQKKVVDNAPRVTGKGHCH